MDVEIHMPREGRVNLRTGDGSIRLTSFKGDHGDLNRAMALRTSTEWMAPSKLAPAMATSRLTGRFDALELSSGDGRIEAQALAGSTVGSGWDLHSGDGAVTVQLPDAFAADVDLQTGDGRITLDMPVSVEGRLGLKRYSR